MAVGLLWILAKHLGLESDPSISLSLGLTYCGGLTTQTLVDGNPLDQSSQTQRSLRPCILAYSNMCRSSLWSGHVIMAFLTFSIRSQILHPFRTIFRLKRLCRLQNQMGSSPCLPPKQPCIVAAGVGMIRVCFTIVQHVELPLHLKPLLHLSLETHLFNRYKSKLICR